MWSPSKNFTIEFKVKNYKNIFGIRFNNTNSLFILDVLLFNTWNELFQLVLIFFDNELTNTEYVTFTNLTNTKDIAKIDTDKNITTSTIKYSKNDILAVGLLKWLTSPFLITYSIHHIALSNPFKGWSSSNFFAFNTASLYLKYFYCLWKVVVKKESSWVSIYIMIYNFYRMKHLRLMRSLCITRFLESHMLANHSAKLFRKLIFASQLTYVSNVTEIF